jgi:hypothetical protein
MVVRPCVIKNVVWDDLYVQKPFYIPPKYICKVSGFGPQNFFMSQVSKYKKNINTDHKILDSFVETHLSCMRE